MKVLYKIKSDYYDYHGGQHDAKLYAESDTGDIIGVLWFSVYNEKPAIQNIVVEPQYRRQGIATALIKELQKEFPETTISLGMSTSDGQKFIDSLKFTEIKNQEYENLTKKIESLKSEYKQIMDFFDNLYTTNKTITPSKEISEKAERADQISDLLYLLGIEEIHMEHGKRLISMSIK